MYGCVLIDVVPGREEDVYRALGKVPAVAARQILKEKIVNAEIVAIIDVPDQDKAEKVATNEIRGISGVHSVRLVMAHHTIAPKLLPVVLELEKQAKAQRKGDA